MFRFVSFQSTVYLKSTEFASFEFVSSEGKRTFLKDVESFSAV